jgi:glucokinase-like ROK family protein
MISESDIRINVCNKQKFGRFAAFAGGTRGGVVSISEAKERAPGLASLPREAVLPEQIDGLVSVLDLVRSGTARTRPELGRQSGFGRSIINQRVGQLLDSGLLEESGLGVSTGGRAPRELSLRAEAGVVLVAPLGATHLTVGVTDLAGRLLDHHREPADATSGPAKIFSRVEELFDQMLASEHVPAGAPLFGIGIGVPGPVEFATGTPVSPPNMPDWNGYDVRGRFARRYDVPVWVDKDVNLMALGELRAGAARSEKDVIFVKVGTGVGAGLIASGALYRGARGSAGEIGHVRIDEAGGIVCRCGQVGCLSALTSGTAIARDALAAAQAGRSPMLSEIESARSDEGGGLTFGDVLHAAARGDSVAVDLITRSGRLLGQNLATLVSFFNPSLVLLGGKVAGAGDLLLAAVREGVYNRAPSQATRDLRINLSTLRPDPALYGAAYMVLDELFSRQHLGRWLHNGTPAGHTEITEAMAS